MSVILITAEPSVTLNDNQLKTNGDAFLLEVSQRANIHKLKSGMLVEILSSSDKLGAKSPTVGDTCEVTYTGTFMDGKKFDSGTTSFAPNQVIKGWTEAMQLMVEGDKWKLYIPYDLAYGEQGQPPTIPAYSPLVFEIQMHKVITGGKDLAEARAMFKSALSNQKPKLLHDNDHIKKVVEFSKKNHLHAREGHKGMMHFPQVVGMIASDAEKIIKDANPSFNVHFVNEVTMLLLWYLF